MATNYPGSLDTSTQQPSPSSTTDLDASGYEHDVVHTNHSGAIIALETKLGTGDSNAVAGAALMGTGSGTSGWSSNPALSSTGANYIEVSGAGTGIRILLFICWLMVLLVALGCIVLMLALTLLGLLAVLIMMLTSGLLAGCLMLLFSLRLRLNQMV